LETPKSFQGVAATGSLGLALDERVCSSIFRTPCHLLDEGELEGTDGYWAEDDEDGAEGFLDALEDDFWV
jgi:hypothetical protein